MARPGKGTRPSRNGLVFGLVVALLIAAFGVAWFVTRPPESDPGVRPTTSPSPIINSASDVVKSYFAALPAGDLETLKAISVDEGASLGSLTSEAIAAAAKAGPVEGLKVTESSPGYVAASYTINGKPVSETFELTEIEGSWKIQTTTVTVRGAEDLPKGTKFTANGAKLETLNLTPGFWEFGTTNKLVAVTPKTMLVQAPTQWGADASASPDLSDAGLKAVRKAIKAKLKTCESDPYGCGMSLPDKVEGSSAVVNKKSMKCTQKDSNPSVDELDLYLVNGTASTFSIFRFACEGRATNGNTLTGVGGISYIRADVSDPDKVKVTFEL